jgi:N-acetylneuraminic acid mutarotase
MLDLDHMNDLELQPEDQERTFKWTLVETTFAKGVPKQGLISHHTSIVHNN